MSDLRMVSQGLFMVVSAPSGTGKTTLCREMLKRCPSLRFSVSHTTRTPRPGEVDGRDYRFISQEDFRARIDQGEFAEWVENYGNFYGTSKKTLTAFLERGEDLMLDLEPRGAQALRKSIPGGVFVFILPPSLEELKNRLQKRAEGQASMERRLAQALQEIRGAVCYDYVIINERLDDSLDRLRSIYLAEKCRRHRLQDRINDFLQTEGGR